MLNILRQSFRKTTIEYFLGLFVFEWPNHPAITTPLDIIVKGYSLILYWFSRLTLELARRRWILTYGWLGSWTPPHQRIRPKPAPIRHSQQSSVAWALACNDLLYCFYLCPVSSICNLPFFLILRFQPAISNNTSGNSNISFTQLSNLQMETVSRPTGCGCHGHWRIYLHPLKSTTRFTQF